MTPEARPSRLTVSNDRDLVVFLIGMRVNSLWRVHEWLPVAAAMPRMLEELKADPSSGLLGLEARFGNPVLMVQYWESKEKLLAYAADRRGQHFPAWAEFNRRVAKTGSVGVWHETYVVPARSYECIYVNMPPFGLGRVFPRIPASHGLARAAQRLSGATGNLADAPQAAPR